MKKLTGAVVGLFVVVGCSPISVKTDYDREVNFAQYRTFKWMPFPENDSGRRIKPNSLMDKRIRRAVERELQAKGYEIIESGKADALLAYHVGVQQKVDVSTWGYRPWHRRTYVHRYKEGSLIVDVVDPRMKQLIWRGWATGIAGELNASEEDVNEAVQKVFKKYPPETG